MKTESGPRDRAMSQIAERQMRSWELQLQSKQRLQEEQTTKPKSLPGWIHPYLAISRETGADGGTLARLVGQKLGWKVLDRELLDTMAEHYNLSRITLDFVDETAASWFHEMFGKWLDTKLVSQAEYVSRLGKIVVMAAQHENTVFVGRGVQFMLPREAGMAVRVIAPLKERIDCMMRREPMDRDHAKHFVEHTDSSRAQFVERYFQKNLDDPHLYDMTINMANVSMDDAAELITAQCRRRFADKN